MLKVVQSDCRTGWYVADSAGKVLSPIFRRRDAAVEYRDLLVAQSS